ncbi:MAG: HAMP domain-containing sensor histidine kinase [Acidobacteriia bacterium]|nr:HAMP domain-containing sensor histidine kinase [Terriglobia bacterium]
MKIQLSPKRKMIMIWTVAIILPIVVLIVFEYISLSNIKSTHAINAVIQRDFMQTLQVVERRSTEKLRVYAKALDDSFSSTDLTTASTAQVETQVDQALRNFNFADAVFYYDNLRGVVVNDRISLESRTQCESLTLKRRLLEDLFKTEQFHDSVAMLKTDAARGEFRAISIAMRHNENEEAQIFVYFALPPFQDRRVQIAGYLLDNNFLAKQFFPQVFREMETEPSSGERRDLRSTIIAIHYMNQPENVIASSQPIDSYNFEVGRIMGYGPWRFFVSEIKPKGETIEGIANHYIRWNFLLVTFIVIVLIVGMLLTLGNMAREIQLAQLKSDFVSNVSHELKTPLALIRLFAETLELNRIKSTDRQKDYFLIIRKESERLTQLINNILDFSRIEAGKKEYKFEEEDLAGIVTETIESYRYNLEQLGFALKVEVDDSLPPLRLDRDAISQAILNLLNNAQKYSQDDKNIAVAVTRNAHEALIVIEDHGIGIAKADQKKIFEKFYRASNSLIQDTKGSGLGLSLVEHIIKAHGGTIELESRVGVGSKFTIHLPLPTEAAESYASEHPSGAESSDTPSDHEESVA